MATRAETITDIIHAAPGADLSARKMFGEYALYCNGRVVALVCDDTLYVKMIPVSDELCRHCSTGHPYPGAKLYYVIDPELWIDRNWLANLFMQVALVTPPPKKRRGTH